MSTVPAREQMIEQQVRAWDVLDARVLETLRKVPREAFVAPQHRFLAFADVEVPLPCGQHMLRPSVVGRLLQALTLGGNERVLDARVLETLRKVPREAFVSPQHRFLSFADVEIPLPCGQHMLRPSVVGRLLQALTLGGNERVLEVGTGSGFVTACLRSGSASVRSLEIFPELAQLARRNIAVLGLRDVEILTQDAMQIEPEGHYDAIAITASLPVPDERFQRRLAVGGRLFVVIGEPPVMEARLIRRLSEDAWGTESLFETVIDPLVHATRPQGFVF